MTRLEAIGLPLAIGANILARLFTGQGRCADVNPSSLIVLTGGVGVVSLVVVVWLLEHRRPKKLI